jgi:hypothetical protein
MDDCPEVWCSEEVTTALYGLNTSGITSLVVKYQAQAAVLMTNNSIQPC